MNKIFLSRQGNDGDYLINIIAILGSTVLSTLINHVVNWRISSKGETQFKAWNEQLVEIKKLESRIAGDKPEVDSLAKVLSLVARSEAISDISKRVAPSKSMAEGSFAILGTISLVLGLALLSVNLYYLLFHESQHFISAWYVVFSIALGCLLLFLYAIIDFAVSEAREEINKALNSELDGNREMSAVEESKCKKFLPCVRKRIYRIALGSATYNNVTCLKAELLGQDDTRS